MTSWATPIVVEHDGQPQLIVPGTERLRAYDLESGEVIWECGGLSNNIVASPVAAGGVVVAGSSYMKKGMLATVEKSPCLFSAPDTQRCVLPFLTKAWQLQTFGCPNTCIHERVGLLLDSFATIEKHHTLGPPPSRK